MKDTNLSCLKGIRTEENAGLTVIDLLRRQARLSADAPALVYQNFTLTYRQFDRLTDSLAAALAEKGVAQGDRLGILEDHTEAAPLAVFAAMKAGAVYVPLNPKHPPSRQGYIVEDAGIRRIIAGPGLGETIPGFTGERIDIRDFMHPLLRSLEEPASVPAPPLPDDDMMIIYTSGSTGHPKGIILRHRNCVDHAVYCKDRLGLSPASAAASYASLSFIMHVAVFFPALISGAAMHIIGDDIRLDIRAVNAYFEERHITAAFLPYVVGRGIITEGENRSLRSLVMGGEGFLPLPDLPPDCRVYNSYGCTECCGGVAMGEVLAGESRITAGTPIYNAEVYVLDERNTPVRWGEEGELCVAGPLVGAGYLNQEEKTAGAFIKNPFSDEAGYERLYKTGDLARITEGGKIEIRGRIDFQIKIRGYRIEPGEIDACIRRYPGIRESVTVAADTTAGVKHLVAYVVSDEAVDAGSLRDYIAGNLPPYMVPQFIERLDALPRNLNGKVDRARLPPPCISGRAGSPPETETEKKLARLWALILGLEAADIGKDADFFELGGDSLRAVMLALEIQKTFETDLSPAEIFKSSRLTEQAALLDVPRLFGAVHVYCETGGKPPLFFVHGGNIGPEAYAPLALKLGGDQPFYCFENYNVFHPSMRIRGIVPLAEKYRELLKARAPSGPYRLGGWSFGGVVAFEMALQLERDGDEVEHLYLLDPNLAGDEEKQLRETLMDPGNYREYLAKDALFERFRGMGLLETLMTNNREISRDMLEYVPAAVYRGKVTLFKALRADSAASGVSPETNEARRQLAGLIAQKQDNGFGKYVPDLRVIGLDEIHDGLMQGAALDAIAAVLRQD